MGKVAGAALKIAAPEAAVAAGAAGKTSSAARHREAIDKIKAERPPEPTPDEHDDQDDQHDQQDEDRPTASSPFAGMQGPATGGGFVLGVLLWAVARAYIGNPGQPSGPDGVKRLLRAKFLNQTS